MGWIDINSKQPNKTGIYKVKSVGVPVIKKAHYDTVSNHWTYDDGFWLPFCVDNRITHWKEITND